MKLKRRFLLFAITLSMGAAAAFPAMAEPSEEAEEHAVRFGWTEEDGRWYYYDANGNRKTGWLEAEGGDGRGNEVWYYLDGSGVMVANETRTIDGVSYTFGEDGAWVNEKAYQGAPAGTMEVSTFTNNWSNIKITFPAMYYLADASELASYEDYFQDDDYASIGKPKLTYDFQVETDGDGSCLELYYADMSSKPDMTPAAFVQAMAEIYAKSDYFTVREAASDVTVGGQTYTKISLINDVDMRRDFYCRKQDSYMVVLAAYGESANAGSLETALAAIQTAH